MMKIVHLLIIFFIFYANVSYAQENVFQINTLDRQDFLAQKYKLKEEQKFLKQIHQKELERSENLSKILGQKSNISSEINLKNERDSNIGCAYLVFILLFFTIFGKRTKWLKTGDVVSYLYKKYGIDVTDRKIRDLAINKKVISYGKTHGGHLRFKKSDIDKFVKEYGDKL